MSNRPLFLSLTLPLLIFSSACNKETDIKASTAELEKAFQPPANSPVDPASISTPVENPNTEAQDLVKAALASARADDIASGVIALESAQRKPGVTAEQVMVVQRAMQTMTANLVKRAASGDKQALAQLKAIEKTRSQ